MAAAQISLSKGGLLSPWKGGGFGMFASLDGGSNRVLTVALAPREGATAPAAGRSSQLEIPASLELEARKAEMHPSDRRLDALAEQLLRREIARGREIDDIHVEVWRIEFAPRTLDPTWRLLNARSATVSQATD